MENSKVNGFTKWLSVVSEDVAPGAIPDEITYGGYTTKNLHHSEDARRAFVATIQRAEKGQIHDDKGAILTALKATDTYMKLNDMHLEQGKAPDEAEVEKWKAAHEEARKNLNHVGEFMHHMDYWHMHEHELQDELTAYNLDTAGAEMADSYEPQGNKLQEEKHVVTVTVSDPNHPAVSKRKETVQRRASVTAKDRETAIDTAIAHYRKQGLKVHDHHYVGLKEELTTKTIKPTDKIKVARVIADMLGVENAEAMSPDVAVATGLRKVRNKRMTPEMIGVIKKMLALAQEVGIKVDHSLIPKAAVTEAKDDVVVDKDSDYNAAKGVLRFKDFEILSKLNQGIVPQETKDPSEVGHSLHHDDDDQVRRMKVRYKTESVELEEAAGQHKVVVTVSEPDHPMVSKRKEEVMKRVIVSADNKDHAVVKAKEFYKRKGYKVHDAEYHSPQPKSSMKTEAVDMAALRKQLDKHTELAIKANRAGDDEGTKKHQAHMNKIKEKMAKAVREEVDLEEAVTVKKQNYSWGKMVTVHKGADASYPLHPEHQAAIKRLRPSGEHSKTSFRDETGRMVHAHREGDKVHLVSHGASSDKTTVDYKHFDESIDLGEAEIHMSADYKTDKGGRKYPAHHIVFKKGEDDESEKEVHEEADIEADLSDEDLEKMAAGVDDIDDVLDVYDDEELKIVDGDTGEEVEDEEDDEDEEKKEMKEHALNEVLSRAERMRARVRFMRTAAKRQRRLQIVLHRRSDAKTINKRARRLAINLIKQRMLRKPVSQMSVAEKERVERMLEKRKALIDRLAMRLAPRVRRIEADRMSHTKSTQPAAGASAGGM